ncbi:hypothetical protein [Roseomonas sp. USHLN139]|uniref:hypothetical protein n=1 Tax=Roseomonas sp. USHLN139 TaxID=3081298 RepID=UPI003B02159F
MSTLKWEWPEQSQNRRDDPENYNPELMRFLAGVQPHEFACIGDYELKSGFKTNMTDRGERIAS